MPLTVHYHPQADKSLNGRVGPNYLCIRASVGTYIDASGDLQVAASGDPRFDHDPVTLESLGIITEPQRTNICLRSEELSVSPWTNLNAPTDVTADQAVAPDGTTTADKIHDDASTGSGSVGIYQNITIASATNHVFSGFFKADQLDWVCLATFNFDAGSTGFSYFDLTNGVVGTKDANHSASGIEDYGNGWYRCWITMQSTTDVSGAFAIYVAEADLDNGIAYDGTSSIFAWGIDVQAGDKPTTYIPTTTVAVQRNKDDIYTAADNSWYDVNGASAYVRFRVGNGIDVQQNYVTFMQSGSLYLKLLANWAIDTVYYWVRNSTQYIASGTPITVTKNSVHEMSGGWESLYGTGYFDGTVASTKRDNVVMPAGVNIIKVGQAENGAGQGTQHIQEIRFYNELLSDAELQAMSTGTFPGGSGGGSSKTGPGLSFGGMGKLGA